MNTLMCVSLFIQGLFGARSGEMMNNVFVTVYSSVFKRRKIGRIDEYINVSVTLFIQGFKMQDWKN